MGIFENIEKYSWMGPLIKNADRDVRRKLLKNLRKKKARFYPQGDYKADVKNLINCMLCPNMCRFDCGTLQAADKETIGPAYKARIGYYLSIGKIDPNDPANQEFIDLMYKCSNEENCKIWCPFDFSVVSLLETVRDDLNDKGLMPDYCKNQIDKLKTTGTIEDHNIFKTYKEKGIKNIETQGDDEVFYYVGCEMLKFPEVVKSNINILKKAGIKFSTNFETRVCCAAPALNIRDFDLVNEFAQKNKNLIEKTGAKTIISDCPGCVTTLKNRYAKIGIDLNVNIIHIVEYIENLLDKGKLKITTELDQPFKTITIHDPCLLSRNLADNSSIRNILQKIPELEIIEPIYNKEYTHCCGWSGTVHWADKEISIKESENRINELTDTGTNIIVSACPTCELGLAYGIKESEKEKIKILDISELLNKII